MKRILIILIGLTFGSYAATEEKEDVSSRPLTPSVTLEQAYSTLIEERIDRISFMYEKPHVKKRFKWKMMSTIRDCDIGIITNLENVTIYEKQLKLLIEVASNRILSDTQYFLDKIKSKKGTYCPIAPAGIVDIYSIELEDFSSSNPFFNLTLEQLNFIPISTFYKMMLNPECDVRKLYNHLSLTKNETNKERFKNQLNNEIRTVKHVYYDRQLKALYKAANTKLLSGEELNYLFLLIKKNYFEDLEYHYDFIYTPLEIEDLS